MTYTNEGPRCKSAWSKILRTIFMVATTVLLAYLYQTRAKNDADGYGLALMVMLIAAVPLLVGCSALSFALRRTRAGAILGGIALVVFVFMSTLVVLS